MPRSRPFRCHTCGALYTGGRCPKCHPSKRGKGQGAGRGSRGRRGRWMAASVLGHEPWPVDVDGLDDVGEGAHGAYVERRTDGTCTTTPELQVQECDGGEEAVSVAPPPRFDDATD